MCGGRGSRALSDSAKSGTESFNCPDSGILCDLNHMNVGGEDINGVIAIT